jgi:hypothetical protein
VFEACIHALEGAEVLNDHVGMIEYFFIECIFWVLHQLVSPGGGGLGTETPPGVSGSCHFFLSHFMTLLLLHPPLEARESLFVTFEACIHASRGQLGPVVAGIFFITFYHLTAHAPSLGSWGELVCCV